MPRVPGRNSEIFKSVRQGAGWAFGVGSVLAAASVLRDGPRDALKGAIKAGLKGGQWAAEATEQVRDIYAEVQSEQKAPTEPAEDTSDGQGHAKSPRSSW